MVAGDMAVAGDIPGTVAVAPGAAGAAGVAGALIATETGDGSFCGAAIALMSSRASSFNSSK